MLVYKYRNEIYNRRVYDRVRKDCISFSLFWLSDYNFAYLVFKHYYSFFVVFVSQFYSCLFLVYLYFLALPFICQWWLVV